MSMLVLEFDGRRFAPQRAPPGAIIHPIVTYTHDWIEFFRPYIYNSVKGITEHRELKRADGYC
eukprot:6204029-Pleurochrysis_carterae.AAC.4